MDRFAQPFEAVDIVDKIGLAVPRFNYQLSFSQEGAGGDIVARDNADAANLVSFAAHQRAAFNGLALVIVKAKKGQTGRIKLSVSSEGLGDTQLDILTR